MNYMNSLGKIMSNFREFYNEINAATLTGAIDVVVVEQSDETFTCSPFHVRFGKLGVLRSREKVVDIVINGEPQHIHMKLGDSGEAFFVEEVLSPESEQIPEYLATSPIPESEFDKLYANAVGKPRRKSIDLGDSTQPQTTFTALENQVNDYTKRRYTDSQSQDYSLKKRDFVTRQIGLGNIELTTELSTEDISSLSMNQDSELSEAIFKMDSLENETPKTTPLIEEPQIPPQPLVLVKQELNQNEIRNNSAKKKRRKTKKKNSLRKISTNDDPNLELNEIITDKSSMGSSQSENELISAATDSAMTSSRIIGRESDFLFFSDTELTVNSEHSTRPNTPVQSDTEFEMSQRKESEQQPPGQSWAWGQLPSTTNSNDIMSISIHEENMPAEVMKAERNSMLSTVFSFMKQNKRNIRYNGGGGGTGSLPSEGVYLADLSSGMLDPEVAALYFPNTRTDKHADGDNDCESGNGPSLPQSPNSVEGAKSIDSDYEDHKTDSVPRLLQDISLSLCGWSENPNGENFIRHIISFTDLCNNPSLLESSDLVVRLRNKYYNWRVATPIIMTMLAYHRELPKSTIEQLCSLYMPINQDNKNQKAAESRGYSSWWSWRRRGGDRNATEAMPLQISENIVPDKPVTPRDDLSLKDDTSDMVSAITDNVSSLVPPKHQQESLNEDLMVDLSTKSENTSEMTLSMYGEKFRKTLRLSSDQIKRLNLKEGMNEVEFSVTTAYQGTTRCKCHIYRWRYDDKIVISDIDGTITKSDVLGHILPIVGKDWAQSGVAQLFTKIMNNGYKVLYLSARAIGQARVTREYLRSIKQGNLSLPDGPLLLNPTSLISAFHREVIEKKPEQFKISCLSDIRALFPYDSNPFYAGYGNRINDVWAYRAVGIPIVRIFTINHKGELKHELTQTFQSSYSNMTSYVDQLFPAIFEAANDYSQFVYWREPVTFIDDEEQGNKMKQLQQHQIVSNKIALK